MHGCKTRAWGFTCVSPQTAEIGGVAFGALEDRSTPCPTLAKNAAHRQGSSCPVHYFFWPFLPLEITYAKRPRHPPSTQVPHGPQPDAPLFARPPQSHTGGDGLICPRALALAKTPRRLTCFPEILYLVYSGADLEGFGPPGVCLVSCHPEESPPASERTPGADFMIGKRSFTPASGTASPPAGPGLQCPGGRGWSRRRCH